MRQGSLFEASRPRCGELEAWARDRGIPHLVGLDEVGRGPLAGPVVAAAVALPDPCPVDGIDDSKALTPAARTRLAGAIEAIALGWAVASLPPSEIDRINILRASLEAMAAAWRAVMRRHPELRAALVLVDGNQRAPLPAEVEQLPVVKGDSRSLNVAAASILAKVARDRVMERYDCRWPAYGFAAHKGYPTAAHRAALVANGPCPIHRRSFRLPEAPA